MTKTVSLPDVIYADLVSVSGEFTTMSKKPFSLGMAIKGLIEFYRAMCTLPRFQEKLAEKLATSDIMSPEAFEKLWNDLSEKILKESEKKE